MMKSKFMERIMRLLITLLGVGVGLGSASLLFPLLERFNLRMASQVYFPLLLFAILGLLGGLLFFLASSAIIERTMKLAAAVVRRWEHRPLHQVVFTAAGLLLGLAIAALLTQLVLSTGASLVTLSVSALIYLVLGAIGAQMGFRRYREGRQLGRRMRRRLQNAEADKAMTDSVPLFFTEDDEYLNGPESQPAPGLAKKILDTSVIIDGRILDIVKTGFLEGEIIIPQFVLAELRHIADSGDSLRRARGRRGLDVLNQLQKEQGHSIIVDETDYEDVTEVDVKLLRLCRDQDGTVVTNDYNLNKVACVTGLKVLNINELANAVKPMLMAGEELTVQIVREGKEPGQGVAYLDDGTMIVVDNGRRRLGESVVAVVTTVLQTSAGRMIFTKLKNPDEKAG
ncbi:MAG: TRAM domain-containing protein [Clostridia bacterium]|nr:TRAM domain-containing protein [Clostridia bacterium]